MIGGGEMFRDFQEYRMLVFGIALVVMMVLRPRGLVSGRTPSVALGKAGKIDGKLVSEGHA
jgi:branched-chain amino acid transport system permease protein